MEGFKINLKTLAMHSQYSESKYQAGFWDNNLGPKSPNLHDSYIHVYSTTVLKTTY